MRSKFKFHMVKPLS